MKSWEDACRLKSRAVQAGLKLGVMSYSKLRQMMIQERVGKAKDKDREISRLAEEYGMTEATVKTYAYR